MSKKAFRHLMDWFCFHGLITLALFVVVCTIAGFLIQLGITDANPVNISLFFVSVYATLITLPRAFMILLFPDSGDLDDGKLYFFKGDDRDE